MLFYPWREEGENLKKDCETFEQMYQTVHRTVDRKAKQYEKNVEELERAIEQAEGDNNQFFNVIFILLVPSFVSSSFSDALLSLSLSEYCSSFSLIFLGKFT
jgi:hypothetical protein